MASNTCGIEVIEETATTITYVEDDTLIIEDFEEYDFKLEEEAFEFENLPNPENPELEAFSALLFDTIYHRQEINEWVV